MMNAAPLVDSFGRVHDNLRISVTDRCNIRCFYCMPETGVQFVDRSEILDFEEIERFVRVAVRMGIRKLRVTGGGAAGAARFAGLDPAAGGDSGD
jgi:cyclic pyranopterin phosphate synthase